MITLTNVSFAYGNAEERVLDDVSLNVSTGECVLLCGKSGCGKSTVLNLINGIIPNHLEGMLTGTVTVNGVQPRDVRIQELSAMVGSVFQNPKSQFFSLNSSDELLFACCNHRVSRQVMRERLEETTETFNIAHLLNRNIFGLSGGEKQKLACASVYMNRPDIYVFDEPSANLDASAIQELRQVILTLKNAGNTIVVAEHRLHYLLDIYDSVIYMESGKIAGRYSREAFVNIPEDERKQMGLRAIRKPILRDAQTQMEAVSSIIVETLTCRHGSKLAVQIEKLRLPKHKVIALVGKNGAGKSTFAAGFSGIHKATARIIDEKALSRRERLKRTFLVMQDVNHQLFTESVLDELMLGRAFDDAELIEQAEATLNQLNLLPWRDEHPQCLSGGQKQRTAIATALFAQKSYLIFDEPTSGVDLIHMMRVAELIQEIKDHVACVLVITHDVEFINYCCEYVIELDAGRVINAYALAVHP